MNFETKIDSDMSVELWGIQEWLKVPTAEETDGTCTGTVLWTVEMDERQYGISDADIAIAGLDATIEWNCSTESLSEEEKQLLIAAGGTEMRNDCIEGSFEISTVTDLFEVEHELEFKPDGQLFITNVRIDFKDRSITIS